MRNFQVKIPAIDQSFYASEDKAKIKTKIDTIKSNFGQYIKNSSFISNVPEDLIAAFIFIESGGDPNIVSGAGATGLMQMMENSATDILTIERNARRMNDLEKLVLQRLLGATKYAQVMKAQMGEMLISSDELKNPELNIFLGTIYLGNLIDRHTLSGQVRLDKVIVNFNKGFYAFNKGKDLIGTIEELVASLNTETSTYITKLLGVNGVMDAIV